MPTGRTYGVLVPLVSGPYYGAVLGGIAAHARTKGGRSLAIQTLDAAVGDDYVGVPHLTERTAWDRIDGLIAVTIAARDSDVRAFHATGKPVLLLSHSVPGLQVPQVSPDNRTGVEDAVTHLVEHGHRRIAFAGFPAQSDLHERYDAYRAALLAHGIKPDPELLFDAGNSMESGGVNAAEAMLAAGLPCTAVIAGNDLNAIGIMKTITAAGYSLPTDLAVIGYDDTTAAQYQLPALTTVDQHPSEVGALAIDLMDRMIDGEVLDARRYMVTSTLVTRASCGCVPGAIRAGTMRAGAVALRRMERAPDAAQGVAEALAQVVDAAPSEDLDTAMRTVATALVDAVGTGPGPARDATPSADLQEAVAAIHAAAPGSETAAAVTSVLQSAARTLAGDTPRSESLGAADAVVREVALGFGAAGTIEQLRTSGHLQHALRAEYDMSMGVLRQRHSDTPNSLDWLANSPVRAACLGLWVDGDRGRQLELVSTFGDVEVPLGVMPAESFPPPELTRAADRHPGTQAAVLPVKTPLNDWGVLAVVGAPEHRTLTGRETYFEWAALLAGALDYDVMVDSLRRQRQDLAQAFERERSLTETIRSSEERYALAAAAANDGLWDWDLTAGTVYYSPRWKALLGYADDEVDATAEEWLSRVHPKERGSLEVLVDGCRRGVADSLELEHRIRARDGSYRWMLCRALAIPGGGQEAVRLVGSLTDVTDRHQLEEQLRRQALYDPLTALPNRPLFLDRLDRAIARRARGSGHFAVVFLDLDGFKLVNDSLGHSMGDALLQQVATRIRSGLRGTDTAARLGGDEFTVLLEGINDLSAVPAVVRKLQERIAAPYDVGGNRLVVTASAGVATSDVGYDAPDHVLRDADIAMYRAKSREPGSLLVFDPSMHDSVVARLQTESSLRRAVEHDELVLHYQPIVDLGTGRMVGMEGLVRWPQADGRTAQPGEFLPVAEASGLMVPIGRTVLRQACRQLSQWRDDATVPALVPVSLNLSHREFWHPDLCEHLERTLHAHDLTPDVLVLEITEGVLMGNVPEAQHRLEELHALGIRLHIDDFGTGYSSLEALHELPIDALKIDRSFVSRMESDRRGRELVATILAMAEGLELEVIAEGIETPEQQRLLVELGCPNGQGFLFARPGPADVIGEVLRHNGDARMAPV